MSMMPRPERIKKTARRFLADESGKELSPAAIQKAARAGVLGAALAAGQLGSASAAEAKPRAEHVVTKAEFEDLAQNAYHEARGESLKGQLAVTQIVLARYLDGRFGRSIGKVIYALRQFSWTNDPKILMSRMDLEELAHLEAQQAFLIGEKPLREALRALAEQTGLPVNTLFYKRTDWDEKNPDEKRMSEQSKKEWRSRKKVGEIGKHSYYAE